MFVFFFALTVLLLFSFSWFFARVSAYSSCSISSSLSMYRLICSLISISTHLCSTTHTNTLASLCICTTATDVCTQIFLYTCTLNTHTLSGTCPGNNQSVICGLRRMYRQTARDRNTYVVVLATSFMLRSGSALSGPRRMQGAKTIARELEVIRLLFFSLDTL